MFTGIIETTGAVEGVVHQPDKIELSVRAGLAARGTKVGDSVAINGCCLTVVKSYLSRGNRCLRFDLLRATWDLTNLQYLRTGSLVNLERSLRADSRLGGNFVTGHIDGVGRITRWEQSGADWALEVAPPPAVAKYLIVKGSIALDGISLTLAAVRRGRFLVWIIPHTREVTALRERQVGDWVNLEADLLGKYVERFVTPRR